MTAVRLAPADFPSGSAGDALTVEFTVVGIPCLGLNGGPGFPHTQAFSFQIATDDKAVVVTDGNLVTSRWPADLPAFTDAMMRLVARPPSTA